MNVGWKKACLIAAAIEATGFAIGALCVHLERRNAA